MAEAKAEKEPVSVTVGSVTVKIYEAINAGRPLFTLCYYDTQGRVRRNFRDFAKAKREAGAVARKLQAGDHAALSLKNEDKANYLRALEVLKPTRKSLSVAAIEYSEAFKTLAGAGTLADAARFFVRHHGKVKQMLVPVVVQEFYMARKADGASTIYLHDIQRRLEKRFCKSFGGYIANVTAREIDDWLRGLGVGGRTRNNFRNLIVTLFAYAKQRGYLPKDRLTEAETVPEAKEKPSTVGILTPEEMMDLLGVAGSGMLPFLAIAGFAGLRSAELERLDWSAVHFKEGHIVVAAEKAKTAQRRIVPMAPQLQRLLKDYRNRTGPVVSGKLSATNGKRVTDRLLGLAEKVGMEWRHNCLRHSFASYRLAAVKSAAQVALEMGNSPAMVFRNYRELVTEKQAAAWFAIDPKQVAAHMAEKKRKKRKESRRAEATSDRGREATASP